MTLGILLTTNDLCEIFQVNRSTIHRWIQQEVLPKPRMFGSRSPRWLPKEIGELIGSVCEGETI